MHGLITVRIKSICVFLTRVDDCILIALQQNHMKQERHSRDLWCVYRTRAENSTV